jgi:aldose 1-epimerase
MSNGMVASVSNYGGVVTELLVPDRIGNLKDVVLGYETLEGSWISGSQPVGDGR